MSGKIHNLWGQIKKQTTRDFDAIFGAMYKVWVINTETEAGLYRWDQWKLLYPAVDSLLKLANSKAHIRTFQSFEFENKWLGFGRMAWNEENNKKWTSIYRGPEYNDRKLQFMGTEIWAPDWNYCYGKGEPPEVFVKVYHHFNFGSVREGLLIAVPGRFAVMYDGAIISSIESIRIAIPDSSLTSLERYWTPGKGFPNRIEDITPHELKRIVYK